MDKELYSGPDLESLVCEWWKDHRILGVRLIPDIRHWPPVFRCNCCQPTCVLATIYTYRVDVWLRWKRKKHHLHMETFYPEDPDFFEKFTKAVKRSRKECYGTSPL